MEPSIWRDPFTWGILVCLGILAVLGIVAGFAQAQEHEHGVDGLPDWYDPTCCNQRDCRPVPDSDIEFSTLPGGGIVARYKPTGNIFTQDRFKLSQDERYHVCIWNGTSLCFYDRSGV